MAICWSGSAISAAAAIFWSRAGVPMPVMFSLLVLP